MFRLSQVRLIGYSLERLSVSDRGGGGSGGSGAGGVGRIHRESHLISCLLWKLRHHMLFFVSNLLFYLQVDVIDAEYEVLASTMRAGDADFKTVLQAHKQFLSAITKMALV